MIFLVDCDRDFQGLWITFLEKSIPPPPPPPPTGNSMQNEKPLLIIKSSRAIPINSAEQIKAYLDNLEINCVFVGDADAQYHQPISDLVDAIKEQTAAINQLVASNIEILDQLIPEEVNEKEKPESFDDLDPSEQTL